MDRDFLFPRAFVMQDIVRIQLGIIVVNLLSIFVLLMLKAIYMDLSVTKLIFTIYFWDSWIGMLPCVTDQEKETDERQLNPGLKENQENPAHILLLQPCV